MTYQNPKMGLISVIIPCFNAQTWIAETLQSVITQSIQELEIIVIDDGSTDGSTKIVEKEFPFVRLVKTKNRGPSVARNLGLQLSKGEFIQYLDADDLLAPGKLKLQLDALITSGADVAYGDWQRLVRKPNREYIKAEVIKRKMQDPEIDLFTDFWYPNFTYLFRRSIVEKIGGFRESLPIIQDARFSLDCALYGGNFIYCQGIMGYYRRKHTMDSVSTKDPVGFVRDCLCSAIEVENWWRGHAGINQQRKEALLKVYGYVARESFRKDMVTFESAYKALNNLEPGYIPTKSKCLKLASKFLGYRKTEALAFWYRGIKAIFFSFLAKGK